MSHRSPRAVRLTKEEALVCQCGAPVWYAHVGSVLCPQCRAKRDGIDSGWKTSSSYATKESYAEGLVLETEATLRAALLPSEDAAWAGQEDRDALHREAPEWSPDQGGHQRHSGAGEAARPRAARRATPQP